MASTDEKKYKKKFIEEKNKSRIDRFDSLDKNSIDRINNILKSNDLIDEGSALSSTLERTKKAIKSESKLEAVRQGALLGAELRSRINNMHFDGFIIALFIALMKDFAIDPLISVIALIPPVGPAIAIAAKPTLNLMFGVALMFIIMFQGIAFKRFILRKIFARLLLFFVIESIPIISTIFFGYTISILMIKYKTDKEIDRLKFVEGKVNNEMKHF